MAGPDSVLLELISIFKTDSNIVTGVIYRMPNSSVEVLNDGKSDIMYVLLYITFE